LKALMLDRQHELLVIGTATSPEFVYLIPADGGFAPDPARFGVLYLQESFLQRSGDLDGAYNQVIGLVHDRSPGALANTLDLLARRLDSYGVTQTADAREQPSVRYLDDELEGLKIQARVMPSVFLGVAALVLNILIGRMVGQQRTVIGTLRAVGYTPSAMTRHYLAHGLAIGAIGAILGVSLGLWIQSAMVDIYRQFFALPGLRAHLYPTIALTALAISLVFAVLGTLKGVRAAARLQPADAMRPAPPETGGRVLPERIPGLWRRLPFRWKMVLRTVFRNPFRSAVSVLASVIATALIFTALSMVDALDYLIHYQFERLAHQDITVVLRDPGDRRSVDEIRRLPSVLAAEPQLTVSCDLSHGPYRKRIGVTGLPPGNRLHTPLDRTGHPISIPERGLILTRKLAELLRVTPGDTVRLRPLVGRRSQVAATVTGTVDSFLGLSAYAHIDYLSELLGEDRVINGVLAITDTGTAGAALLEALQRRPAVIGISERARALAQLDRTFGETMGIMIAIMVLFAGTIAFGSVLNATLVSLSERQREVSTLRVLGYSPGQLTAIFAGESYLLHGLGLVLGLFTGVALAHGLSSAYSTELYRFPTVILPASLALSALLMGLFITLAQVLVYRLIRHMDWLAVLNIKE
jgi:putative ABC transport system permease protein